MADGVIELVLQKTGERDVRYLRVIKERGSDVRDGEHAFKIARAGSRSSRAWSPPKSRSYDLATER